MTDPRRPFPSPTLCLILGAIALLVGVVTGIFAAGDRILPGDIRIATTIQRASGPVASGLATIGNTIGWTTLAAFVMAAGILVAAVWRARADVVFLATLLVLRLAAYPLKAIFASPRPTEAAVTVNGVFDGYGYPSGHSLTGATLLLGLAVLAWRHIPSRKLAIATIGALVGLLLLVGWSRIWVGAHWPSDVVGGFAFGVVIVTLGVLVTERVAAREVRTRAART